jgi:3-methyladenine DNA glycosylase AlkD
MERVCSSCQEFSAEVEKILASAKNREIAEKQTQYLRGQFPFFGITKPVQKQLNRSLLKTYKISEEKELHFLLLHFWKKKEREFHYFAIDLAKKYPKLWTLELFAVFEEMIRTHAWWDSVDDIASNLIGPLLKKFPQLVPHMDHWINDSFLWIRRTALIYQLKYKEKTDASQLFKYCAHLAHEKDFFIRKAIGWALREYHKTSPDKVLSFVEKNKTLLSPLSIKEALKHH